MYSLLDLAFWANFFLFLLACLVAFFIPGNLLIKRLKLDILSECVLSILVGFVMWILLGLFFGFTHMRFLLPVYISISLILWIKINGFSFYKKFRGSKFDSKIFLLIFTGTIIQLSSVFLNGVILKNIIYYCCGLPDTLFHLALTNELTKNFPPNEPALSNIPLHNYHFLSSLGIADLINVFGLPLVSTSYQYATVLFSVLLGLSAVALTNILELNKNYKLWLIFLLYFSGDIIFLLPFIFGNGLDFTLTTLENASSLWVSPPRFYSLVVLLTGLSLFVLWIKKKNSYAGFIMAFVFASLIGLKVYTGAIILSGFLFLSIYFIIRKKFKQLIPIILMYVLSFVIYFPINSGAGGLYFTGFWRFEDFIVQESLGLSHLELARRIYLEHHNALRVFSYDLLFGALYVFFSSGVLVLGIIQSKKSLKQFPLEFNILACSGLLSTCAVGFFFLQKTGGANSSQFLISIYIIGCIYTALSISWWLKKFPHLVYISLAVCIIILTSARVVHDTYVREQKITKMEGAVIRNEILESYKYLENIKDGTNIMVSNPTSLDCIFMTYISNKSTYMCSIGAPDDRGRNLKDRQILNTLVFNGSNTKNTKQRLRDENIMYLYLNKPNVEIETNMEKIYKKVFENNSAVIFKVTD